MNMSIVMSMNIYITPQNEYSLRKEKGSMSGLINQLLNTHYGHDPELSESTSGNLIVDGELTSLPVKDIKIKDYTGPSNYLYKPRPIANTKVSAKLAQTTSNKREKSVIRDNSGFISKQFSARKKK